MSDQNHLQLLLIEDNSGDARLIMEMLSDTDELSQRVHRSDTPAGSPQVHHESKLSEGLDYLESEPIDVVLLDLHLPDSTGIETLTAVVEATEQMPVVVLTGLNDRRIGIEAIQRGAQEYLVKDEVTSVLLVRSLHHAIERKQQEIARIQHQEHLQTLNRLNTIVRDISHTAIQTTTREELERHVCERLVESDTYRFAWIGEVERGGHHVVPRVAAGSEEGYLDEVTITIGGESDQGPTAKAIRTQETHVTEDLLTDPRYDQWRETIEKREFRSSAAIPLVYDEMLYGVLNVYSSEQNTFSEPGAELLEHLGEIIGHAISAIERKEALISDTVHELEFQITGIAESLVALTVEHEGSIHVNKVIQAGSDGNLLYGSITEITSEQFLDATSEIEWVENVRLIGPSYNQVFEVTTAKRLPFIETLASYSGKFRTITITDGDLRVIAELPQQSNTRRVLEKIQDVCPGVELLAQRTTTREAGTVSARQSVFEDQLTEKQRIALESAYSAGFFDTPRTSSGEEIAQSLDVSPATFFQHLRKAQNKLFGALLDRED